VIAPPVRSLPDAPGTRPTADRPPLGRLVGVELRKSTDTRAGFWLLLLIGAATLAVVVLLMVFGDDPDRTFANYLTASQLPVGVLLPVLAILLVTSEWAQRTALTTFTLVPVRSRVLTAKALAACVLGLLAVAASLVAAALGTLLTPALTDSPVDWGSSGTQLGQIAVVQVATVLVGVAFGMLLLSSPLAIVAYFLLPTLFTVLATTVDALTWVRDWLDLTTTTAPMYEGRLDGQGWLQVATSLLLWGVVPAVAGWLRIERAEIS
jgi:hypothetical protein